MTKGYFPVLFFDGDCGLCSRSVRFLMRQDHKDTLYYAPLQGTTAARQLDKDLREALSTVVYQRSREQVLVRSDAVFQALIDMKSSWRFLARPALLLPRRLRDGVYKWIAKRREKISPKVSCPLPTVQESSKILP